MSNNFGKNLRQICRTSEKVNLYKKAYVELYELIKVLSIEEQKKIPMYFITYIKNNMDTEYTFYFNKSKGILEQDYSLEIKALIVKMYEKYLAPKEQKEFWNNYDRICLNIVEDEKKSKYNVDVFKNVNIDTNVIKNDNPDNIIKVETITENTDSDRLPIPKQQENIFKKVFNRIMNFFHIK